MTEPRLARWSARGQSLAERGLHAAERLPGAGIVSQALERQRMTAAALLAGGLAYKFFFWLVPFGLVLAAVAGFWVEEDPQGLEEAARDFGLGAVAAHSAAAAIRSDSHTRWYFLVVGTVLLLWFSIGAVRALKVAAAVAWNERPERLHRPLPAGLLFTGVVTGMIVLSGLTQLLRERMEGPGLLVALAFVVVYAGVAFWCMALLPHGDAPPRALIPGAILVAVGMQALHLLVLLYLAPRLGRSSELYGTLGSATVILLWLFLTARLIVGGLFLNAARWQGRAAPATHPAPGP